MRNWSRCKIIFLSWAVPSSCYWKEKLRAASYSRLKFVSLYSRIMNSIFSQISVRESGERVLLKALSNLINSMMLVSVAFSKILERFARNSTILSIFFFEFESLIIVISFMRTSIPSIVRPAKFLKAISYIIYIDSQKSSGSILVSYFVKDDRNSKTQNSTSSFSG